MPRHAWTDDPRKPLIWYYYPALMNWSIVLRIWCVKPETYRWADLESICIQYLSDIKSMTSSYFLGRAKLWATTADIQAQRQQDMLLISEYPSDKTVELSNENSLNPYIYFVYGYSNHHWFYQKFQLRYQKLWDHLILSVFIKTPHHAVRCFL